MQPYEDKYGILRLIAGQPFNPATQPSYQATNIDPKPRAWRMLLKPWHLFKINALKRYRFHVLQLCKVFHADAKEAALKKSESEFYEKFLRSTRRCLNLYTFHKAERQGLLKM